jgi:hypothetical protein
MTQFVAVMVEPMETIVLQWVLVSMLNIVENVNPMKINLSQRVVKQTEIVILDIFAPKIHVMP